MKLNVKKEFIFYYFKNYYFICARVEENVEQNKQINRLKDEN